MSLEIWKWLHDKMQPGDSFDSVLQRLREGKTYILKHIFDIENIKIFGVFTSPEKAREYVSIIESDSDREIFSDQYILEEFQIDSGNTAPEWTYLFKKGDIVGGKEVQ